MGTRVPQTPQNLAVSFKREPQLPQNLAIAQLPCQFVRFAGARSTRHLIGEREEGDNSFLPALKHVGVGFGQSGTAHVLGIGLL